MPTFSTIKAKCEEADLQGRRDAVAEEVAPQVGEKCNGNRTAKAAVEELLSTLYGEDEEALDAESIPLATAEPPEATSSSLASAQKEDLTDPPAPEPDTSREPEPSVTTAEAAAEAVETAGTEVTAAEQHAEASSSSAAAPPRAPRPKPYSQVTVFRSWGERADEVFSMVGSQMLHTDGVGNERTPSIFVCPECQVSKPWLGFGGAFTEASCVTLHRLSQAKQDEVLRAYFDVDTGLGYNMGRLHIGSCDFSLRSWTCGEVTQGDMDLSSFSINRYRKAIIPMVKRAQALYKGPLDILASPWSPFPWMKTEQKFNSGSLKPEYASVWAKHFVRFIQEFQQIGIPIWGVSVQNEPASAGRWESCIFTAEEERDFVRDHLGPAFAEAGLESVRIIVGDHNRDGMLERAAIIYGDPEAAKYVWGVGYHWYGDARFESWADFQVVNFNIPQSNYAQIQDVRASVCFDNVRRVSELRPDKHILFTEGCQELNGNELSTKLDDWKLGERYAMNIIADMNSGCEGWIDWNLCLDSRGGPNHARNFCVAPFIIDHDTILLQPCYWFLLHFARFIRPGARRVVCSSSRDALEVTAWLNPGDRGAPGTTADNIAVVVLNQTDQDMDFWLKVAGAGAVSLTAPGHSIHTLVIERDY